MLVVNLFKIESYSFSATNVVHQKVAWAAAGHSSFHQGLVSQILYQKIESFHPFSLQWMNRIQHKL